MTDADRIARLEYVLGTLIGWLYSPGVLSAANTERLMEMLRDKDPEQIPTVLRKGLL